MMNPLGSPLCNGGAGLGALFNSPVPGLTSPLGSAGLKALQLELDPDLWFGVDAMGGPLGGGGGGASGPPQDPGALLGAGAGVGAGVGPAGPPPLDAMYWDDHNSLWGDELLGNLSR